MSFIIIYGAMQRAQNYQPGPPLTPRERKVATICVVIGVIALTVLGVFVGRDVSAYYGRLDQLQKAWNVGEGRPAANKIEVGKTLTIKAVVDSINDDWTECTHKTCYRTDFPHYPVIVPIGTLSLEGDCYTEKSDVAVDSVMVSASRPDAYSVAFEPDHKTVKFCRIGDRQDGDRLMVWSDDANAAR